MSWYGYWVSHNHYLFIIIIIIIIITIIIIIITITINNNNNNIIIIIITIIIITIIIANLTRQRIWSLRFMIWVRTPRRVSRNCGFWNIYHTVQSVNFLYLWKQARWTFSLIKKVEYHSRFAMWYLSRLILVTVYLGEWWRFVVFREVFRMCGGDDSLKELWKWGGGVVE